VTLIPAPAQTYFVLAGFVFALVVRWLCAAAQMTWYGLQLGCVCGPVCHDFWHDHFTRHHTSSAGVWCLSWGIMGIRF
jgi:hypothetical protein